MNTVVCPLAPKRLATCYEMLCLGSYTT